MKILFLQDDFPPHAKGGAGIVAAALARQLAKQGHELIVVTAVQDKKYEGSFYEDGMRIERICSHYAQRWRSWRSLYNLSTVPAIRRIIFEVRPDIVHAHNVHYHLSYWALRIAKKSGARVFLTAHDVMLFHYGKLTEFLDKDNITCERRWSYKITPWQQLRKYRFWYNPFRNIFIHKILSNVDRIFAVSAALKEALEQNGIRNIEVLHNGIDIDWWQNVSQEDITAFKDRYNLSGKKCILFGGRINAAKGGDVILNAFREILHAESNVVLLLLGTQDVYMEKLMVRAKEWGIENSVVSTGWLSGNELRTAYHVANIVVMPSLYLEPFGMIALEAMACGKPVVGSCFGGIPEVVIDGETGYIVNPFNIGMLVDACVQLLGNSSIEKKLGSRGKELVQVKFSLINQVKFLEGVYKAYQM